MGIMVYSFVWVVQDFVHQPYLKPRPLKPEALKSLTQAPIELAMGMWRYGQVTLSGHVSLGLQFQVLG